MPALLAMPSWLNPFRTRSSSKRFGISLLYHVFHSFSTNFQYSVLTSYTFSITLLTFLMQKRILGRD